SRAGGSRLLAALRDESGRSGVQSLQSDRGGIPRSETAPPGRRDILKSRLVVLALLAAGLGPIAARAADPLVGRSTARVGLSTTGIEGNGASRNPSVS